MAAQSEIERTQLKKLNLGYQYAEALKNAVAITKMQIEGKKVDVNVTKQFGDGIIRNAQ